MDGENPDLAARIKAVEENQELIIDRVNKLIDRVNRIPRDIKEEKERLMRKANYLEGEIESIKHKSQMPDEDI